MITVIGATDLKAPVGFAGIPIGLVLVLIHLVGIPVTNTSVNPARQHRTRPIRRWLGLRSTWLFIVAPLVGAVLAAVVYRGLAVPFLTAREAERYLPSEQAERLKKSASA